MSSQTLKSLGRFLAIGSAAFLVQIGAAGAADQGADLQAQMQEVLAGRVPARAAPHTDARRHDAAQSSSDFQSFARQLLQGWSVAAAARPLSAPQRQVAADRAQSQDIQALVRRQLLGA